MRMTGLALIACALLAWCLVDQSQAQTVGSDDGNRPVLFLGNESLPPMCFMENGKPAGIVVDLARAVAKRMHRPVEIRLMNWTKAQELVLEGRADALIQINPSPDRMQRFDFSGPLLNSEFTIFTSAERLGISSMGDLRGLKVGVEEKGLPILLLKEDPQIGLEIIPDFAHGFKWLEHGKLDAVIADRWVGSYVVAENHIRGVKLIEVPFGESLSAFAVRKGNTDLLQDINAALADIRRDGTYDDVIKSWRSKEVVFRTREQLREQSYLIGAVSAGLIAALAGILVLVMEIRKRRRLEHALRESEERLRLFIEHAPAALAMFDCDMRYLKASRRWLSDYHLGERSLKGLSHYEVFPEIGDEWKSIHRRALAGEVVRAEDDRFTREDGSEQWLRWEVHPWKDAAGEIAGIVIFTEDVTERKRAEKDLRENEEKLRSILRATPVGIGLTVNRVILEANDHLCTITGYSREELIGSPGRMLYPSDEEYERVGREKYGQISERGTGTVETRWRKKDGAEIHVLLSSTPLELSDPSSGVTFTALDITARKTAEQRLQESEERLRRLGDNLPDSAVYQYTHTPDGGVRFLYFSAGIERLNGVSVEDVLRDAGTLHRQIPPEIFKALAEAEVKSAREMSDFDMEVPMRRPDGEMRWMRLHSRPRRLPDGCTIWDGVQIDVTERKQAEEALRENERRLIGVLEGMPDAFVGFDSAMRYTYVNANAERLQAARREELLGQDVRVIYPDAESYKTISQYERVIREQKPLTSLSYHAGFDRWVEVRAFPTPDGVSVFYKDVSAQVKAEEALRLTQASVDAAAEMVAWFTPDGGVCYANDATCRTLGYCRDELLTMTALDFSPGFTWEQYAAHWQEVRQRKSFTLEVTHRRKDGSEYPAEVLVNHVVYGGGEYIFAFGKDITERKQAEEELRKSRDELELRVQERTAELELFTHRLRESNQALQEFASIASHDMQEPLRKVISFGDMLKQKYGDAMGDGGKDYLERMLAATERMQSLLRSLLEYSRVSSRAEPSRQIDLSSLVGEVLSDLEVRIQSTGGEVQIGVLPTIEADPTQMRQLFQNLISNALKFHKEEEAPVVKVRCSSTGPDRCEITVQDNGIGFEERYLEKIFAPFQRLHGRSSSYEGTGMGLAICKKIVERHRGAITARSRSGEGSVFVITLPVEQPKPA